MQMLPHKKNSRAFAISIFSFLSKLLHEQRVLPEPGGLVEECRADALPDDVPVRAHAQQRHLLRLHDLFQLGSHFANLEIKFDLINSVIFRRWTKKVKQVLSGAIVTRQANIHIGRRPN